MTKAGQKNCILISAILLSVLLFPSLGWPGAALAVPQVVGSGDTPVPDQISEVSREPVLVILAELDLTPDEIHVSLRSTTQQDWVDRFFTPNADPPSIRDYFFKVSDGQLELVPPQTTPVAPAAENGVVGWYPLGKSADEIKEIAAELNAPYWSEVAAYRAVQLPSIAGDINYKDYDTNDNGTLELEELHIYVILSAYESDDSLPPFSPRSQRLFVSEMSLAIDDIVINNVAVTGEMSTFDLLEFPPYQTKMGLIAHEMGHSLGWGEHYKGIDSVGEWCLMAEGDRGGGGKYPNYPCAYERWSRGWYEPQVLETPTVVSISSVAQENDNLIMIPEQFNGGTHFYLIENRQDQPSNTFDSSLPGSGLLVWEVDSSQPQNFNARLVRADNAGPKSDAGDPFPGSTDVRLANCSTTPRLMDASISEVSDAGTAMTAKLGLEPASQVYCSGGATIRANGFSRTRINAVLVNDCISEVHHEVRMVTFTIISGGDSAQLVGPTTVATVGGNADCSLQAKLTPGEVVVEVTSPGLPTCTATTTITEALGVWHVSTSGSDEAGTGSESAPFASVQRGVDAATNGETVVVHPGVYEENVVVVDKGIHIVSEYILEGNEDYLATTVLQPPSGSFDSVVRFSGAITFQAASLVGFTIRNGLAATGGGISCEDASPLIDHCRIEGNRASSYGAGIYLNNSDAFLSNLEISNNAADFMDWSAGGGLASWGGSPVIQDVKVQDNSANANGGGWYFAGGGSPSLSRVTAINNTANGRGGGVYCSSGAAPKFFDADIGGNTANYLGGGVYCDGAQVSLRKSFIYGNVANAAATDLGGGGVFADYSSSVFLVNVTMTSNQAEPAGGIQIREGSTTVIVNSIIWGNSNDEIYVSADGMQASIHISHSDLEGGEAGIQTNNNAFVNWRTGNLANNPGFVAGPSGPPYQIGLGSPCVDSGIAKYYWGSDLLLDLSPDQYSGSAPDMGGFEFPSVVVVVSPDGLSGYSSIGDALQKVPNGTVIELMDGIYSGIGNRDIDFEGRSIVLRSRNQDAGRCIIDCRDESGEPHRAFHFHSGEGAGSLVEAVTILYGNAADDGLGGSGFGGGALCENGSSPTFRKVTFAGCASDSGGGGLASFDSSPSIENCTFFENNAPTGSGLYCVSSSPQVSGTLIVNGNSEAVLADPASTPGFSCSNIYANSGGNWSGPIQQYLGTEGNLSENPLFCESDPLVVQDWSVMDDSPCLPQNNAVGCLIGAWQTECLSVPNFLSVFRANQTDFGAVLSWHTSADSEGDDFEVIGTDGRSEWVVPHQRTLGNEFEAFDKGPWLASGGHFEYDLMYRSNGQWSKIGTCDLDVKVPGLSTKLREIFPNPFNPQVVINFSTGKAGKTGIKIYDVSGKLVIVLQDGQLDAGEHERRWDGRDAGGRKVASGVYFVRLTTAKATETRKIAMMR